MMSQFHCSLFHSLVVARRHLASSKGKKIGSNELAPQSTSFFVLGYVIIPLAAALKDKKKRSVILKQQRTSYLFVSTNRIGNIHTYILPASDTVLSTRYNHFIPLESWVWEKRGTLFGP